MRISSDLRSAFVTKSTTASFEPTVKSFLISFMVLAASMTALFNSYISKDVFISMKKYCVEIQNSYNSENI